MAGSVMRKIIAAFFVLLSSVLVIASAKDGEWIKYASPEGRYEVSLPQEPKLSTQQRTAPTGENVPQYLALATEDSGAFIVGYFDYRSDMTFSIDNARDGMLEGSHATLLGEETISLEGSPGKQIKFLAKANGLEFIDRARLYDINRRVYVLQCIFPKDDDGSEILAKCAKFFDSFKVQPSR